MRRRDFLALGGAASAAAAWSLPAAAQKTGIPQVARLAGTTEAGGVVQTVAWRGGLADRGFIEGETVAIEWRWLNGNPDLALPVLAELLQRRISVLSIYGLGGSLGSDSPFFKAVFASGIPTVSGFARDPRRDGFIANLNRPERNLTGVNQQTKELEPKRLNLLHEVAPQMHTVAYLARPSSSTTESMIGDAQPAARQLGLQLVVLYADSVPEIDAAFGRLKAAPTDGLIVSADPFFNQQRDQVLRYALELGLPAIGEWKEFAQNGALLSYGTSQDASAYQQGAYVAAILKGSKVADLPVIQLNAYEFVINLRTAKAMGLTVPPSTLAQATQVIS